MKKFLIAVLACFSLNAHSASCKIERANTFYAVKTDKIVVLCSNIARSSVIEAGPDVKAAIKANIYSVCMTELSKLDTLTSQN